MIAWFRCWFRNHHNPVRHPLGGFKCADCGEAGDSLDDMGFIGDGYVAPLRRTYDRDRRTVTLTPDWPEDIVKRGLAPQEGS